MRITLLQPPDEMEAMLGEGKALVQKLEPLGLLYIGAVCRDAGCDVEVIDAHAEDLDRDSVRKRLLESRPDVLGISTLTCGGEIVFHLGKWVKENLPETLVVLGNIHASVFAKEYLENGCCDVVIHGEGEGPFLKAVEHRRGKCARSDIPNASFVDADGKTRLNPKPALVEKLASLPRPARELVDRSRYHGDPLSNLLYVGGSGSVVIPMTTSRGCGHQCTFCVVNQRPRYDSPERVVDEMETLEKEHGAGYTLIVDPLCMRDPKRMLAICSEYRKRGLSIRWGCDARVDCVNEELLDAMAEANCHDLSFGIESGVQRLLDAVKKGTRVEKIADTVAMVRRRTDLLVAGLFVLGLPGETPEDSLSTIAFAKSLPLDMAQFSILTPYPGSPLFEELRGKDLDTGVRDDGSLDPSVWKRYSAYISFTDIDPIWVTPEQTPDGLKALQRRAQREFYLRPSIVLKHLKRVRPSNLLSVLKIARKGFL